MNKKMEADSCPQRGSPADLPASACPACGSAAKEQAVPSPAGRRRTNGLLGAFFSVIFSILLSVLMMLFAIFLFLHALGQRVMMPAAGPISDDWLALLFQSWYSLAIGGALVLVPLAAIILINAHSMRRSFLAVGCSMLLSAIFGIAAAITAPQALKLLPGAWQDILVNSVTAFGDFCIVWALLFIVIGAACLSIYSCIAAVKGGRHEKGA